MPCHASFTTAGVQGILSKLHEFLSGVEIEDGPISEQVDFKKLGDKISST